MKVAVSIPEPIFSEAELLAKRFRTSRSELYARALNAYVESHSEDRVADSWNAVVDAVDEEDLSFVREAARQTLARTEW